MIASISTPEAELALQDDGAVLHVRGPWTLTHFRELQAQGRSLTQALPQQLQLDVSGLDALDTAGARQLCDMLGAERVLALVDHAQALLPERKALLVAVAQALQSVQEVPPPPRSNPVLELLERIGIGMHAFWRHVLELAGFIGMTLLALARLPLHPQGWRMTALVANLEQTGLNAVPIIALLTFMIGAVVAFLGATVLADFGATIYTVDLVAFSYLREFGVLLTAILVAGRTASAFTAQIGSMKSNEEIDAIRVQGLDLMELLVLPRVLALLLALPMLTFLAMLSGILGGMVVCFLSLDISAVQFLEIVKQDVSVRHFWVGMAKAPVMAFLIAVIGCMEGFRVQGSAQSVGEHTTSAVVQSIFVVILVDAIAALFYMEMEW